MYDQRRPSFSTQRYSTLCRRPLFIFKRPGRGSCLWPSASLVFERRGHQRRRFSGTLRSVYAVTGSRHGSDDGGEWWHRYVHVGVEPNFPSVPNALEIAMRGIAKALVAIKPEHVETIKRADETVREHGEHLRFLLRRHETKKFVWQVSSNVAVWPKPSYLYVAKIDVETNAYAEAEPIALQFYSEALSYSRKIKFKDLTDFTERPRPPATSTKILQR
jgi:hypothetical protein